jgi:hypothetical protein
VRSFLRAASPTLGGSIVSEAVAMPTSPELQKLPNG